MIRFVYLAGFVSFFSFSILTANLSQAAQLGLQPNQDTRCELPHFQQELMQLIQAARAHSRYCGNEYFRATSPLRWNSLLNQAAAGHSTDMANRNYFDHQSWDGTSFSSRISRTGYQWTTVGENISAGRRSAAEALNSWLKSPHHCVNIMAPKFSEVGVACVKNPRSTYQYYWTMELGHQ